MERNAGGNDGHAGTELKGVNDGFRGWSGRRYKRHSCSGMVVAVECREGEWGYGGVRLEEMVLVTETGNRILSNWPAEEIIPVASVLG